MTSPYLANGTKVRYHYRSAMGHGVIIGIHKHAATSDDTEYSIREADHHVAADGSKEPAIVYHYGRALTVEN